MTQQLLALESYFSDDWHAREERSFESLPRYLGHDLGVGERGSFAPSSMDKGLILARQSDGSTRALKNSCPHRGARLCDKKGEGAIVCPLHQWSYSLNGDALGFQPDRAALKGFEPVNFLGLLFDRDPIEGERPSDEILSAFNFDGYALGGVSESVWPINWKSFMEMHLDLAHIFGAHPGLASMVDCERYGAQDLSLGVNWSWQRMRSSGQLDQSPSEAYREYAAASARLRGEAPVEGAQWLTIYPRLMLEKNPECLMVSVLEPRGVGGIYNRIEFYYTEEALAFEPELAVWHQKAYAETAEEDLALCLALEAGRRSRLKDGGADEGFIDPLMEACLPHLHQWASARMGLGSTTGASEALGLGARPRLDKDRL